MTTARFASRLAAPVFVLMLVAPHIALGAGTVIETPGPAGPLQGTLLRTTPGAPTVVIVPGSGPTDRDGNNRLGVVAATYRLLAEALAARGIASVRIDKRGMFGSERALPDANKVTIADYAGDVSRWAKTARGETGAACIWVLGHSEGGLVALATASDPNICGLILVATPGRKLGDVLRDQLRANPANAPILGQAFAAITAIEHGNDVDVAKLNPALAPLFHPAVQGFLKDAMSYDPAKLIAATGKPVLIEGERDVQVLEIDAHRLKEANPRAELAVLPDVNHVLKVVTSPSRAENLTTYADPNLPIAPAVVDAIAAFISKNAASHSGLTHSE
jgi:pimeloyl-ACP methyl ester carboxylesterase